MIDIIDGRYFTGCQVPERKPQRLALYEDSQPMLSVEEIRELISSENRTPARKRFPADQWIRSQGGRGSCFPPGTLIRMGDGSQKPIDEVKLLDEVLTAEGRVRRVMRTMVRPHAGKVLRICVWGNRHIRCTNEHPFLTQHGYVAAENLTKDHWVAIPRFAPQKNTILDTHAILPKPAGVKKKTYWKRKESFVEQQIPGKAAVVIHKATLPDLIELDYDFGWLLGLFCAEGNLYVGKVTFSLHVKEETTLAARLSEILKRYGVVAHVSVRNNNCSVNIHSKQWVMLFEQLCGTGSKHKGLHPAITSAGIECLRGVIDGWQAGDGLGDADRRGGVTISHTLAMNMYDIANAIGYMPTVETLQVKINPKHKIKERQLRYVVAWPTGEKPEPVFSKRKQDEKTVWRKIAKIEEEEYSGFVYNLEVEDDHSYVAEGVGVHNCNGYAGAWALSRARVMAGLPFVALSGEFLYSMINGGRDSGSMLDDGMKAIQERGVAREELVRHESYLWSQMSAEARQDAGNHKAFEAYRVDSELGLASGLVLGFIGVVAVHASNAWSSLSGGISRRSLGPGNHAVCCQDVGWNGRLIFDIANSWGRSWGDNGHTWNTWNDHLVEPNKYHDFYLIRGVTDKTENDIPEPK